jgi:5-formyltetrahydrofolate cyclo-ligase
MTDNGTCLSKDELRKSVYAQRRSLAAEQAATDSMSVQKHVMQLPCFSAAETICCYLSVQGEVATGCLVEECLRSGKTLCVPAFCSESGLYRLSLLKGGDELARGALNVPEPEHKSWLSADRVDVTVVPGVAFDAMGGRVGHGGGHYDRILGETRGDAAKVGIAFGFQVFPRVPMAEADVFMDILVTENGAINCTARAVPKEEK